MKKIVVLVFILFLVTFSCGKEKKEEASTGSSTGTGGQTQPGPITPTNPVTPLPAGQPRLQVVITGPAEVPTGESTLFQVSGGTPPYTWQNLSTSGSVSSAGDGSSATFLPPTTNSDCTANGQFVVRDSLGRMAIYQVAVNGYRSSTAEAYGKTYVVATGYPPGDIQEELYSCDGNPMFRTRNCTPATSTGGSGCLYLEMTTSTPEIRVYGWFINNANLVFSGIFAVSGDTCSMDYLWSKVDQNCPGYEHFLGSFRDLRTRSSILSGCCTAVHLTLTPIEMNDCI
jgi:hypothetical protein